MQPQPLAQLRLAAPTCWGTGTRTSLLHPNAKLPGGQSSSCKAAPRDDIILTAHFLPTLHHFCGGVWGKAQHTFCVHSQKGQRRGVPAHLIPAFPNFQQLRTAWCMNLYNTYICTQTFIWSACLEYEIVCMRTVVCFP